MVILSQWPAKAGRPPPSPLSPGHVRHAHTATKERAKAPISAAPSVALHGQRKLPYCPRRPRRSTKVVWRRPHRSSQLEWPWKMHCLSHPWTVQRQSLRSSRPPSRRGLRSSASSALRPRWPRGPVSPPLAHVAERVWPSLTAQKSQAMCFTGPAWSAVGAVWSLVLRSTLRRQLTALRSFCARTMRQGQQ